MARGAGLMVDRGTHVNAEADVGSLREVQWCLIGFCCMRPLWVQSYFDSERPAPRAVVSSWGSPWQVRQPPELSERFVYGSCSTAQVGPCVVGAEHRAAPCFACRRILD
mmetsp:Transcript_2654/g.6252  ORF Transcript_2654/g.6252 Transcript_2654/m.6252 type:complete len:109 (+) Transcript_2654:141-467(+)